MLFTLPLDGSDFQLTFFYKIACSYTVFISRHRSTMDNTQNSNTERSVDIGPEVSPGSPIPSLREHFLLRGTITHWTAPRFCNYNSYATRLRSYEGHWPSGKTTPHSLSKAGFYYYGKIYYNFDEH
jgi:hypothetical protein